MITRIHEAKTLIKHISCNYKCKFYSATCNSNQKWNNDKCQCECKKNRLFKRDYSWNPSTCISENRRYLKSIVHNSVIVCDKIMNGTNNASTNVTNTISVNVTSNVPTNVIDTLATNVMSSYFVKKCTVLYCIFLC